MASLSVNQFAHAQIPTQKLPARGRPVQGTPASLLKEIVSFSFDRQPCAGFSVPFAGLACRRDVQRCKGMPDIQ